MGEGLDHLRRKRDREGRRVQVLVPDIPLLIEELPDAELTFEPFLGGQAVEVVGRAVAGALAVRSSCVRRLGAASTSCAGATAHFWTRWLRVSEFKAIFSFSGSSRGFFRSASLTIKPRLGHGGNRRHALLAAVPAGPSSATPARPEWATARGWTRAASRSPSRARWTATR